MTKRFLVLLAASALLVFTACDATLTFDQDVEAVGDLVTVPIEASGFESLAVGNSFEVFVEVGDAAFVEIVVNESLVDDLDVRVRNGELKVGLKNGVSVSNGTLEATVRMPKLREIEVSGASSTRVLGVVGPTLEIEVSGASDLRVEGSAESLSIDGSGASAIDIRLSDVQDADIDLSGASSLEFDHVDTVTGDMSGASQMSLPAQATVDVDTSGASDITGR